MGTSMRAIRRHWQLRLLKRERPGNSMTEKGTVSTLFNKKVGQPHGKKVSSVNAIVCVATIAHSQWKSLVTWTDLSNNGHIDELVGESATSV